MTEAFLIPTVMPPPGEQFLLFGMGSRRPKLLYRSGGSLVNVRTGTIIRHWEGIVAEQFEPAEHRVLLTFRDGATLLLTEAEDGIWQDRDGNLQPLVPRLSENLSVVAPLPRFEGHPQAALLRALHHDLLTHIAPNGGPLPNLFVYDKPWFRDAAMVAFCLEGTGHLGEIADWVLNLSGEPFDRNNAGHREPDNLGQILMLIALCGGDAGHPMVQAVMEALPEFTESGHLIGLSDVAMHPVYQTKWLKYGLRSLGVDDTSWKIPAVYDSYSALFWMDYREQHVPGEGFGERTKQLFPYLAWAEAHFHNAPIPSPLPVSDGYPLTWEAEASQADYGGLARLGVETLATARYCTPHTWHAAEMYLYLLDVGGDPD